MEASVARHTLTDAEREALVAVAQWVAQAFKGRDTYVLVGQQERGEAMIHLTSAGKVVWNTGARNVDELADRIKGGE